MTSSSIGSRQVEDLWLCTVATVLLARSSRGGCLDAFRSTSSWSLLRSTLYTADARRPSKLAGLAELALFAVAMVFSNIVEERDIGREQLRSTPLLLQ